MNNISAVFWKQLKETLRNQAVLIQFVMFPVICIVMSNAVKIPDMPHNYFVHLFSGMYIGMAPLISISSIVAEEKEKNTLRVLIMANVKSWQYLLGTGSYVLICCTVGSLIIGLNGGYALTELLVYLCIMVLGVITSLFIGASIGIGCKNMMVATSVSVPVMMIFAFVPMLAMFNEPVRKLAYVVYTEQMGRLFVQMESGIFKMDSFIVVFVNMLLAFILFILMYKRQK